MSQPYSRRFYSGAVAAAAGTQVLATVPAGKRWIIRDVARYCSGGAGLSFLTWPGPSYSDKYAPSADGSEHLVDLHVVLDAGEDLATNTSSGSWYFVVSGYELDAP
jgi:hypothetical protein